MKGSHKFSSQITKLRKALVLGFCSWPQRIVAWWAMLAEKTVCMPSAERIFGMAFPLQI